MEQRTTQDVSPYRVFSRAEWAMRREDTPMTLTQGEVARLRSMHDLLDMSEVEEIYLPLSRLLSFYVAAMQRLFGAQQAFLGTEDAKMPYIIGVGGSVAVGKSTTATEPPTPMMNGILASSVPRNACCAPNNLCIAAT